jgi:predicted NBD/HSP70 family sugar kinase
MQKVAIRGSSGREFLQQRVIGIRIIADAPGHGRLLGIVTDMLARVVADQIELKLESFDESKSFAQILTLVDDLRAQIGTDERLVGVGLEIGGHVYQGRVVYSANAHWGLLPLEDRLADVLRLPVVLENDANALAIYERRFEGIAEDSLAVILLTYFGVGCGLILDGQIYRGVRGMSGEIGHLPISGVANRGEVPCRCGNDGCLERIATPSAIEEDLKTAGFEGGYEVALESATVDEVSKAFKFAGAALGSGAATIINLLNPSAMVFYGPSDLLGQSREFHIDSPAGAANDYAGAMVAAIRSHAFSTGASDCRFIVRNSVDVYGAQAAAACLINKVLPAARIPRD